MDAFLLGHAVYQVGNFYVCYFFSYSHENIKYQKNNIYVHIIKQYICSHNISIYSSYSMHCSLVYEHEIVEAIIR